MLGMVRSFIMVCWVGWEQLREMVWYDSGIRKLGDGDVLVTGGGTEIKVSIPSHPIPPHPIFIPFRCAHHPNTLARKALFLIHTISYICDSMSKK